MRKWKGLRCFGLLTLRGGAGFGSVTMGVWFGLVSLFLLKTNTSSVSHPRRSPCCGVGAAVLGAALSISHSFLRGP